jgi:hypothetical protein
MNLEPDFWNIDKQNLEGRNRQGIKHHTRQVGAERKKKLSEPFKIKI